MSPASHRSVVAAWSSRFALVAAWMTVAVWLVGLLVAVGLALGGGDASVAFLPFYTVNLVALALLAIAVLLSRPHSWVAATGGVGAIAAAVLASAGWVARAQNHRAGAGFLGLALLVSILSALLIGHISRRALQGRWLQAGMVLAVCWAGFPLGLFSFTTPLTLLAALGCCRLPFWMLTASRSWPSPPRAPPVSRRL